jgi:predicted hydrocarbon binding protein
MNATVEIQRDQTARLTEVAFERLFGDSQQRFDLYEGTIHSVSDARIIYLSADIIRGTYEALSYEAGEAWGIILRSCGLIWGKRVSLALNRELHAVTSRRMESLTVSEYISLLEQYFARHGWGRLKLDLAEAERCGVVRAEVHNSIFATVLADQKGSVNQMIEGLLAGLIGGISEHDLACLEVVRRGPPDAFSEFFISGSARLEKAREAVQPDMTTQDLFSLFSLEV